MRTNVNLLRALIRLRLLQEKADKEACPEPTQDKALNAANKGEAAVSRKIAYMHPEDATKILALSEEGKLCGNCAAFNISEQMVECGGASRDGETGYCMMHEFSCTAKKTCLTWAPGGPKRN